MLRQLFKGIKRQVEQMLIRYLDRYLKPRLKLVELELATLIKDEFSKTRVEQIRQSKDKIFTFNVPLIHAFHQKYPNVGQITMYLPNVSVDHIQTCIVVDNDFYDTHVMQQADKYFKDEANILDLGSNIGSNALYYALVRKAKKVYAFEPLKKAYEILCKNIKLNSLQDVIVPHNMALGEKIGKASIKYSPTFSMGGTALKNDENGNLVVKSLDELQKEGCFVNKIDFLKIDVEGFESHVLRGGGGGILRIS
ncbi:FkbM family methyltransferase [Helicobacter felis]|uniref:Methyltransferase,FkbM family protein n=2 Tax=Helicobacter felis TaxID=214 RepID=E7ABA8_HELFC|nr:FkbM family methyltransferase [Helicobacter felis]CBY83666.1 methyltransferase,FkbM family protein [Helicobacter felis ATCC 49179]